LSTSFPFGIDPASLVHAEVFYQPATVSLGSGPLGTSSGLLRRCPQFPLHCVHRMFASQTEGELKVTQILKEKFPRATAIKVTDISGGCGAMYEIKIESEEFKEKRTVQQHQMVNQALKEEIKSMHGLRIFTSVPKH
ncbi:bolA-like protein 3, partial [Marmota marmota marmota]